MSITVEVTNSTSTLRAEKEVVHEVQRLVAYQEEKLPPLEVQLIAKTWARNQSKRFGYEIDIERLYREKGLQLFDLDWPEYRWNEKMWWRMLKIHGFWDGWTPLVTAGGVFGTGLLPWVRRALEFRMGLQMSITDHRKHLPAQPRREGKLPKLFDFQREAVDAIMTGCRGVIDLPPRSGKTIIALAAVKQIGRPALFVVPRKELVRQTVETAEEVFGRGFAVALTGGAGGSRKRLLAMGRAPLWVATPMTAAGSKGVDGSRSGIDGIASREVLIVDEFHHSAASTYLSISEAARNAYWRIGLTGTHFRADNRDLAMHSVLSDVLYSKTVGDMIELGRLVPARVVMVRVQDSSPEVETNAHRNRMIEYAAHRLGEMGKRTLVIAKQVRHAQELAEGIPGAFQVDGTRNEDVRPALDALERGETTCVVGTSVIGEGVDVPAADALVLAQGGLSKVTHVQTYFRVLTASGAKSHGLIVDFADQTDDRLVRHAANRLNNYRSVGFEVAIIEDYEFDEWLAKNVD